MVTSGSAYVPESEGAVDLFHHTKPTGDRHLWVSPDGVGERLARTFELLGAAAPDGYSFHAAWVRNPADREVELGSDDLARLARANGIDEDTLYRVH